MQTNKLPGLLPEDAVMLNVVIAYANAAGARWGDWVVAGSLEAALLLALIGLVWFVLRKRVAPQVG